MSRPLCSPILAPFLYVLAMSPELGTGEYLVRFEREDKEVGQAVVAVSYDLSVVEVR